MKNALFYTLPLLFLILSCKKPARDTSACKLGYNNQTLEVIIDSDSLSPFCLLNDYSYQLNIAALNLSNISWNTGDTTSTLSINAIGVYEGTGINVNNDTITFSFEAINCASNVYIPNTFTPNGDGLNDTWKVYVNPSTVCAQDYKLIILNDNQKVIFSTSNYFNSWDGTTKGVALPTGVYHYILEYKRENGEILELNDQLLLVR